MTAAARVTLRDVAHRAGCHYSTVSLALRGHRTIPEPTRERIQEIARKLGYRPDPLLASLSSYRHDRPVAPYRATLAWVTNFPTRDGWRNEEIYLQYFMGARNRALELGFQLQEFWLREENMTPGRASEILTARGIQGLIIAPQATPSEVVMLEWSRFSAVAIGYSMISPALHMVCPNQYRSMKLAMERLIARGYRRIGLVMLQASDERVDHNWLAGYLVMQQRLSPENRLSPQLLERWDERGFAAWLRRDTPDAILSKCAEALPALRRLGLRLPQDLGAAFLTRVKSSREMAGIDERPLDVGAAAVEHVVAMQHHNERGVPDSPRRLLIEGEWIDGRTVACPPPAQAIRRPAKPVKSHPG